MCCCSHDRISDQLVSNVPLHALNRVDQELCCEVTLYMIRPNVKHNVFIIIQGNSNICNRKWGFFIPIFVYAAQQQESWLLTIEL